MAATVASSYNAPRGYQPNMTPETSAVNASASVCDSASSSKHSSSTCAQQQDLYGFRERAELCEKFILYLFACPLDSTSASATLPTHNGTSAPRLSEFIAYALYRTRLPDAVTFQALYLLLRLKIRFPSARGSSGHRLFISALMIASKSSCDDTYSNKSWAIVGQGLFSLREINQMERELFGYLGYKVNVSRDDLGLFCYEIEKLCHGGRIDVVVLKIFDHMSRRGSVVMGDSELVFESVERVTTNKSSAPPTPALEACAFSSPSLDSHAGTERSASGRHSRQSSASQPCNPRASIASHTPTTAACASTGAIATTTSMAAATAMVKSASHRQERCATAPSFMHPFISNARERCRPYTTPVHSMPLSSSLSSCGERSCFSDSPAASISSSSMCSSMSYAGLSAASATPSPYASRCTMSGRTTPDTPPSDMDTAQWDHVRLYSVDAKPELSPSSTVAYKLAHQMAATPFGQHATAADAYLHPYNGWRS